MRYLENNICEFKLLFDIDYTVKKNIISCSFFKMINKGYKDFNIYIKGIKELNDYIINHVNKKYGKYNLRLFIDNSIYNDNEIMNKLNNMKGLEIVLYTCSDYLNKNNNNYHIGLFGTIVRFFPMFDFPNNDANYVVISDIDDIVFKPIQLNLDFMKNRNQIKDLYFLKIGNLGKNVKYNYNSLYKGQISIYSIAQSTVSLRRFDQKILENFIEKVRNNKEYYSYYYNIHKNISDEENIKKYTSHESFIYGIDEYFLNKTLTEYLIDNSLPYALSIKWNISHVIYYLIQILKYLSYDTQQLVDKILNYIIKRLKINAENKNIEEKFKIIDDISYSSKDNKIKYKINKLFYKVFLYVYNNPKYRKIYPKDYYEILLTKEFYLIYDFNIIKYYNIDYKDIIIESHKFINGNIFDKIRENKKINLF